MLKKDYPDRWVEGGVLYERNVGCRIVADAKVEEFTDGVFLKKS